jgi:hypothetical protein
MDDVSFEDQELSYYLYKKISEILIGKRVDIALLALSKCKVNLLRKKAISDHDKE